MSEQTFVQQLVQESLPVWEKCLHSEFLTHLADGTLDEACFKGYIVEDSLYLREYAKVFAWGMTKAKDMQTIRTYYSLLSFVNESEDAARLHYLKHFGLTDEGIQSLPLRPENRAYVDSMIEAAKNGEGAAECMMACLPCMLSYGWIFQKLLEEKPSVQDTLYGALVVDYADKGYEAACRDWAAFAEKVCEGLSDERLARCREIFHACSEHELNFWAMAASPRSDLSFFLKYKMHPACGQNRSNRVHLFCSGFRGRSRRHEPSCRKHGSPMLH